MSMLLKEMVEERSRILLVFNKAPTCVFDIQDALRGMEITFTFKHSYSFLFEEFGQIINIFVFLFISWHLGWQPSWAQWVIVNSALRTRVSIYHPRILMFTPPHSFSKLIYSFLSATHLRLLHFWIVPLLPGLFVQVVLDRKHAAYSNLQIKKKILLGHPGVAIGKFTTLELYQCQTRVHLRWITYTVTFWDLRYYQSYAHLRCLC